MRLGRHTALIAGLVLATGTVLAEDWPHFLGPNYDRTSAAEGLEPKGLTEVWSRDVNAGCSSMTIVDGRLYTMGNDNGREFVYCLNAQTGEQIWAFEYACDLRPQLYEGGPNSTPTIAGGRAYTLSKDGHVHCLDAGSGDLVWAVSAAEWKPTGAWWGFSDSPIVWDDKVFLNIGTRGLALDRATGKVVWSSKETAAAYGTILPLPEGRLIPGRRALVVQSCKTVDVVDPATGESMLGELPAWATRQSNCNGVAPAVYDGSLFIMHGGHGLGRISHADGRWTEDWLCADIKYDARGWFTFNRQVIHDGYLFALTGVSQGNDNRLKCVNLSTGKVEWQEAFGFGNLILSGDLLISLSEEGEIRWGKLNGATYKESHRSRPLDGGKRADGDGPYWSHPVLHNGRLYARSNRGRLTCFQIE